MEPPCLSLSPGHPSHPYLPTAPSPPALSSQMLNGLVQSQVSLREPSVLSDIIDGEIEAQKWERQETLWFPVRGFSADAASVSAAS